MKMLRKKIDCKILENSQEMSMMELILIIVVKKKS